MKRITYKIAVAVSALGFFASCTPEIEVPAPQKGSLDVSKYVAIGGSVSAGYADNALYQEAQTYSYPNLLAQQFKAIGGGEFKQPLVPATSVGIGAFGNARYGLMPAADCSGAVSLLPQPVAKEGDFSIMTTSVAAAGPFNNLSVPGVKAVTAIYPGYGDFSKGTGNYNPFYSRITANPQMASLLSEAAAQNPSFFTLALGNDDVMGYAVTGGVGDVITPSEGAAGYGFNESINVLAGTLASKGAKGALANVPYISHLPFFTTIPYNGLMLDATQAAGLSAAYAQLGLTFQAGYNGFVIADAAAPGGFRKAVASEYILLNVPGDSLKCAGWGSAKPIPDQYVLTATEVAKISEAITAYNAKLKATADAFGLAYVDANGFMSRAGMGILYNGVGMNTTFVEGGLFSLDGIHLTPRGNALLANEFIAAINAKFGASIAKLDVTKYKGVAFP